MISIIILEPRNSGNLGAICRVMKNFGFKELILVNPCCNPKSITARKRSMHALDILTNAKIIRAKDHSSLKKYLRKFDHLIATTSQLGTDYNITRSPITPAQLVEKLKTINLNKTKLAIVFGRENHGLSNDEINLCDFAITVPTNREYPSMNLSHAISVILYELSKLDNSENPNKVNSHILPASDIDKKIMLKFIDKIIKNLNLATKEKEETMRKVWKKIVGKSFVSKREAFALLGFFRKLSEKKLK